MKGLLVKDFKLMKAQKKFVFVFVVMAVVFSFVMENTAFLIGYLTFVMPFYGLSTISYDEFDNGNPFLFTLPISRKLYVMEKYCFSALLGCISFVFGIVFTYLVTVVKHEQGKFWVTVQYAPIVLIVAFAFLSLMLPLQLKLGAEKARVALIGVCLVIFVGGYACIQLLLRNVLKISVLVLMKRLFEQQIGILTASAFIFVICAILISIRISIGIMRKKEF